MFNYNRIEAELLVFEMVGGGGGIRTRESFRSHAFQACALGHYATPP